MKTLLAALLVAGALLLGTTSSPVGAAGVGPHPAGLVPHVSEPTAHASRPLLRTSTPTCNGSSCTGYESAINRYFTDVAAAASNHATDNVYSVATQYCQGGTVGSTSCGGGTTPIAYNESFGGSLVDTSAYPANGCNDTVGGQSDSICLTNDQLRAEIQKDITANGWPNGGTTNLFFIFTPSDVGICGDSSGPSGPNGCSTNAFCAFHDYISSGSGIVYAVQPYDATIPGGGCDFGQYPNGNDADATINTVSHEQNEAITDPDTLTGWYTASGNENGDLCAWTFGTTSGSSPAEYTQTINGHHYWLQEEYSNAAILNGGCVQHLGGAANGPALVGDGVGPLLYNGGPVMTSNTVYAIYWVPSAAPANSSLPAVSGTAAVGKTLSTSNGSWSNSPTSYSYKWQSCSSSGTNCTDIGGATGSSYKLQATDAGHEIRSEVSAQNASGSSSYVASAPTEVVVPVPATTAAPAVSGVPAVGKTLSTTQGTWNTPVTYAYQWLRCAANGTSCASIGGATSATYKIASADAGHALKARVSATNAAATTAASSAPTAVVIGVPKASAKPSISGKAKVGKRLAASSGSWSGSPSSFRYQWLRCSTKGTSCARISGATKATYRLAKRDLKHRLRVRVTAVNAAGKASATSATTRVVKE